MRKHYPLNSNGAEDVAQLPWKDGVPQTGVEGSYPGQALFTDTEAEILAAIDASGQARNGADLTQLIQAIGRGIYLGQFAGTTNQLLAAIPNNTVFATLPRGMKLTGFVTTSNTAGVTLSLTCLSGVNAIVQAPLLTKGGAALKAGDLPANQDFEFRWDGSAFRLVGSVASEINTAINTYILGRPPVQHVYIDEVNGSESNDGLSITTPKKSLDAAIDAAAGISTQFLMLSDCTLNMRHTVYVPHLFAGILASGGGNYTQFKRTLRWLGTATNSPAADGTTFCAGIFSPSTIRTDFVDLIIPDVSSSLTYQELFTSTISLAVVLYNATVSVAGSNGGYLFGAASGKLTAACTISVGPGAAGHLFRGIGAGVDPNAAGFVYDTNVTSA